MKHRKFLSRAGAQGIWASVFGLFVLMPLAQATELVARVTAPMTVLAMIKTENDVLAQWQAARNKVAARKRPKPTLLSIYGVLPQLRATVLIDGREVVFEQGRKQPLFPQTNALRLRLIKPPCVSFTRRARLETVCLSRVGS